MRRTMRRLLCGLKMHRWESVPGLDIRHCNDCGRVQVRGFFGHLHLAAWLAGWRPPTAPLILVVGGFGLAAIIIATGAFA